MPSRSPSSPQGLNIPSTSPRPDDSIPSGSSSIPQRALAPVYPTALPRASQQYITNGLSLWDSDVAVASILDAVIALPAAFVQPVTQVLDVASGVVKAVKTMREGKRGFERLLRRVLNILQSLVDELRTIDGPIDADTPTVKRLSALERYGLCCRYASFGFAYFSLLIQQIDRHQRRCDTVCRFECRRSHYEAQGNQSRAINARGRSHRLFDDVPS
jgi:hypothetical protein